ncbi:sorting nexin-13-like [Leptopilina heterotoma]|uniref:sorting nexin-13-like n=1 Tax=Leptopilina heterotoma TaxID=63436 RepID=UPI001CA9A326|nr:sorting nexin-13-like [Leptopilina heterotoma]
MNVPLYGTGAIIILIVALFDFGTVLQFLICIFLFILGSIVYIYKQIPSASQNADTFSREDISESSKRLWERLEEISKESKEKMTFSQDRRITGSRIIDESLQEILDFVLRDYVESWYSNFTNDQEFLHSVRDTAQKIMINVSNRVKEVDWIPYLTTRLVDDAASHMRLYQQARAKMKQIQLNKLSKTTSTSTSGGTPKRVPTHRRNMSDTDISWYSQSKFYTPNLTSLTEPKENKEVKNCDSLENIFFDLEVQMEKNFLCRDLVCTNEAAERTFLTEISEVILYLVLPKEDFDCIPLRFFLRDLFVNVIIRPLLNLLSDPDYINQTFIWLCSKEKNLPSDIFLTVIRITDNLDELLATNNIVNRRLAYIRSKEIGGEDDVSMKQELNSLLYMKKILDTRIIVMQEGLKSENDSSEQIPEWNRFLLPGHKLIHLPLDELLKNNIALSYFIDFMTSINAEAYLYFYLNIYGWRVSAEQQISEIELEKIRRLHSSTMKDVKRRHTDLGNLKEAAVKIYQQYLTDKANIKLQLDDTLVKHLLMRIKNESIKETWFDELQICCYEKLKNDERFLPAFKRSASYVKLLAELDLLKDSASEDDTKSLDSISVSSMNNETDLDQASWLESQKMETQSNSSSSSGSRVGSDFRSVDELEGDRGSLKEFKKLPKQSIEAERVAEGREATAYFESNAENLFPLDESLQDENVIKKLQQGRFRITATIIETGIVSDKGKTYGIYAVAVTKTFESGYQEKWHIYRRYSDFHDLYQRVKEKYFDLAKIPFPGKKTFHNMERSVLEKRMVMLNAWLNQLTKPNIADGHMGLQNLLLAFLEQGDYDKGVTGGHISRTIDTLVNPLKSSMKTVTQAVKTMPDNMISTVDGVMDKLFGSAKKNDIIYESVKVGASLDTETDDNIPLRIILLLMDEIFDLKVRNQWLRRRIVTLLRQIIRTMFGDIVNRRIIEYVSEQTSPKNVAKYLNIFKNSFWPKGMKAGPKPHRTSEMKSRTRIDAKVALLACFSDELKHIIGSETTRCGLLRVFELFQRPVLNRRLLYVLLEGIIETLFPKRDFVSIIRKLYSVSPHVKNKTQAKS